MSIAESAALEATPHPVVLRLYAPREDVEVAPVKAPSKLEASKAWLLDRLTAGPVASRDLESEAHALSIGKSTLRDAKSAVGVEAVRSGRGWVWSLIGNVSDDEQERQTNAQKESIL
jgi:hypothetical protein